MQLSRATEYALLGLSHLAREKTSSASVGKIAKQEKLSLYFLRNIFQKLKAAKLLNSQRGQGYSLAKEPEIISLKIILESVEGPISIHSCLKRKDSKCVHSKSCKIIKAWKRIQKKFIEELKTTKLSDLI